MIEAKPWWRDPTSIPPRQFLYGRHYIRRSIGATVAAGGRCKTTLSIYEAVTMAIGRDLDTGEPLPDGALSVWLLNGEEGQDELDRRVAAVCQRYRATEADLGGRLFVQSVRDRPMRVATMGNGGAPVIGDRVVNQMVKFIGENRIDVFMIDPLVSFHGVNENDNSHMDLLVKQGFGSIANKTNSAGELFLLRHKFLRSEGRGIGAAQHGHRGSVLTRAAIKRRRIVAIEFETCRSRRNGGASGSVTVGNGRRREHPGGTRS